MTNNEKRDIKLKLYLNNTWNWNMIHIKHWKCGQRPPQLC